METYTQEQRIKDLDASIAQQEKDIAECQKILNYAIPRLIQLIKIRSKLP